jgi:hypothetical protein
VRSVKILETIRAHPRLHGRVASRVRHNSNSRMSSPSRLSRVRGNDAFNKLKGRVGDGTPGLCRQ